MHSHTSFPHLCPSELVLIPWLALKKYVDRLIPFLIPVVYNSAGDTYVAYPL